MPSVAARLFVKPSQLQGLGVFAETPFESGETICSFGGERLSFRQLPQPYDALSDHYMQIDRDLWLGPSGEIDDFFNHSCEPNSGVKFMQNRVQLIAARRIERGEEILFDYSTTMNDPRAYTLVCSCGTASCRRIIGNFDTLSESIKRKYNSLGMVLPYLVEPITLPV